MSFGMLGSKPIKTPLEVNFVFSCDCDDNSNYTVNIIEFQKLIGKVIYLTVTRPYISYVVQVFSQYMHRPRKSHLNVAFRMLRYLKSCLVKGVFFLSQILLILLLMWMLIGLNAYQSEGLLLVIWYI